MRLAFAAYGFAIATGLRAIIHGSFVIGLKLLVAPVGYWRFLVNGVVLEIFARTQPRRVLDVSSPKLLSLMLARQAEVWATDLDDPAIYRYWGKLASVLQLKSYRPEYQDATRLRYPDETFDLVYSISVIEHIPGRGDCDALVEFRRVLKPGGTLVIEVPYRRISAEITAGYDSKGAPLSDTRFYERHYDAESLKSRLCPEGLMVEDRAILGEKLPFDAWISGRRLPKLVRIALLPFEPWMAAINYWIRPTDSCGRPLAAMIVYRKVS